MFDFEELEYHYQVANRTEDAPGKDLDDDDDDNDDIIKPDKMNDDDKPEDTSVASADAVNAATTLNNSPTIDNPYLRAAKVPKRTKSESVT